MADSQLADITHTIQLAVAPVFLLSAVAAVISVLTTRLGRIIDRARRLEEHFEAQDPETQRRFRSELDQLSTRAQAVHRALTVATSAALAVCLLIIVAFLGYLFSQNLGQAVAVLFILAMGLFVVALLFFLQEIFLSVRSLRFGEHAVVKEPSRPPEVPPAA
jgi:hypothetical protein